MIICLKAPTLNVHLPAERLSGTERPHLPGSDNSPHTPAAIVSSSAFNPPYRSPPDVNAEKM
jgi:hypothetical protein